MQYLVDAWDWLNDMLDYPLIALLAGGLLSSISFLFSRVRKAVVYYSAVVFRWSVERLTAWQKTTYKVLSLARQEDVDELRRESREAIKPTAAPSVNEAPAQRTITRGGTKITLNDRIWHYLGKEDPRHVDSGILDGLLQGPFCEKCSYALPELSVATGRYNVIFRCPKCYHQSSKKSGSMNLDQFKEWVYRGLDAEFRQTGTLKDSV
jgi:hypothetical protein